MAEKQNTANDAQRIISEYKLDKTISEMYNTLVHERSKQPALFMVRIYV